jgi:exodeoxyribonuclease VII small subunit
MSANARSARVRKESTLSTNNVVSETIFAADDDGTTDNDLCIDDAIVPDDADDRTNHSIAAGATANSDATDVSLHNDAVSLAPAAPNSKTARAQSKSGSRGKGAGGKTAASSTSPTPDAPDSESVIAATPACAATAQDIDTAATVEIAPDQLSFKAAFGELEDIVRSLEGDALELEENLVLYERGVALLRSLKSRLDSATQKVEVLMGTLDSDTD